MATGLLSQPGCKSDRPRKYLGQNWHLNPNSNLSQQRAAVESGRTELVGIAGVSTDRTTLAREADAPRTSRDSAADNR